MRTGLSCNFILSFHAKRSQSLISVQGVYSQEKWTKPNPLTIINFCCDYYWKILRATYSHYQFKFENFLIIQMEKAQFGAILVELIGLHRLTYQKGEGTYTLLRDIGDSSMLIIVTLGYV